MDQLIGARLLRERLGLRHRGDLDARGTGGDQMSAKAMARLRRWTGAAEWSAEKPPTKPPTGEVRLRKRRR